VSKSAREVLFHFEEALLLHSRPLLAFSKDLLHQRLLVVDEELSGGGLILLGVKKGSLVVLLALFDRGEDLLDVALLLRLKPVDQLGREVIRVATVLWYLSQSKLQYRAVSAC